MARRVKGQIMNGKNNVATRPQPPAVANGCAPAANQPAAKPATLEHHRIAMSRGELVFYLRDVHPY
jgi:hypothetical protein